jgi:hypothetical protein
LRNQRWLQASGGLGAPHDGDAIGSRLCEACVETLGVSGAGITLIARTGAQLSMGGSDATVSGLAKQEYTLGCGPAVDAYDRGEPVSENDLVAWPPWRWPVFARCAVDAGFGAVFAFPLGRGETLLGTLTLFKVYPGEMDDDTHAAARIAADFVTAAIVARHTGMADGVLMAELTDESSCHFVVHQAAGMVAVRSGISTADALACLRARAFRLGRLVDDVAGDVVARRLRIDD